MDPALLLLLGLSALGAPLFAGTALHSAWSWRRRLVWVAGWLVIGWAITAVCAGYWLALDGINHGLDMPSSPAGGPTTFDLLAFWSIHHGPWSTAARYLGWIVPMVGLGVGVAIGALVARRKHQA